MFRSVPDSSSHRTDGELVTLNEQGDVPAVPGYDVDN